MRAQTVRPRSRSRGFTLIEIMIVVVIIGVLSTLAYPMFRKFSCRSKQAEAKIGLKTVYATQDSYRSRQDTYIDAASAPAVLYPVLVGYERYRFNILAANNVSYTAEALGKNGQEMEGDRWTVTELFDLTHLTPDHCR